MKASLLVAIIGLSTGAMLASCQQNISAQLPEVDVKCFDIPSIKTGNSAMLQDKLSKIDGVKAVTINASTGQAAIIFQTDKTSAGKILYALGGMEVAANLHDFPASKSGGKCPVPHELLDPSAWFKDWF